MKAPLEMIKNFFKPIIIFKNLLGSRVFLAFFLIFISSALEIFGFMMLMPLLQIIIGTGADSNQSTSIEQFAIFGPDAQSFFETASADLLLGIIIIAFFGKGLFTFCAHAYIAYLRGELSRYLKGESVRAVFEADYLYITKINSGTLVNTIGEQTNRTLTAFYQLSLTITQVIVSIMYILSAFILAPSFGALVALAGILMFALFRILNVKLSKFSDDFVTQSGQLQRYLNDLIFNQKYFRLTSSHSYAIDKAHTAIDDTARYQVKMGIMSAITHSVREPVAIGVLSLLILLVIKTMLVNLELIFIPLILYYRGLNSILTTQIYLQNTLEFMGAAYKVTSQLNSLKKNIPEPLDLIPINNWQSIHATKFSYEYQPKVSVLNEISFQINRNQVVGIVGSSGSGKTTLVDLIAGLAPSSIMVDDTPLSKVRDWGKSIGYVSQDVKLIDGSVQDNITLQNSSVVDFEVLREVIRAAQLEKTIEKLPHGLNSVVVDQGAGLSGGEKQRILIARALYRQPKLLIFDEATSALDNETEYSLRKSLETLKGKVTILIVAHRLSTVRFCDNIIVLENGKIVESGTYLKLSKEVNSKFSKLIAAESRGT